MINRETYTEEHIKELQKSSKRDPGLIERTLHAFGLLEAITRVGMSFIFKGGTCLMLLLEHPMRLSTDIDIIVKPGTPIKEYIQEASKIFPFKAQEEQVRVGRNNIEKRHFKFTYESPINGKEIYILLDVLFEENHYASLIEKEIQNELLITDGKNLRVNIPSVNCILGDKLTAFAPHTTGILLNNGKDMEVLKQMYDVCTLIDVFDNYDEMIESYDQFVVQEIAYRGAEISKEDVLEDTFNAALCIAARGKFMPEEYHTFVDGMRSLKGHIFAENYTPEIAARRSAKVLYMVACMKKEVPFERIKDAGLYKEKFYSGEQLKDLKYLRKIDLEAYAYTIETDLLLNS